jgi:hypothetical protein
MVKSIQRLRGALDEEVGLNPDQSVAERNLES